MTNSRKDIYDQLIHLGYSPMEAWEYISEMDFAEDNDTEISENNMGELK